MNNKKEYDIMAKMKVYTQEEALDLTLERKVLLCAMTTKQRLKIILLALPFAKQENQNILHRNN